MSVGDIDWNPTNHQHSTQGDIDMKTADAQWGKIVSYNMNKTRLVARIVPAPSQAPEPTTGHVWIKTIGQHIDTMHYVTTRSLRAEPILKTIDNVDCVACPECDGLGETNDKWRSVCPVCRGFGHVVIEQDPAIVPFVDGEWSGVDNASITGQDVPYVDGSEYAIYHGGQMFRGIARSVDKAVSPGWVEIYIKGHGTLVKPIGALRPLKTPEPTPDTETETGPVDHIIKTPAPSEGVTLAWAADHIGERVLFNTGSETVNATIAGVTDTAVYVEWQIRHDNIEFIKTLHAHPSMIAPVPPATPEPVSEFDQWLWAEDPAPTEDTTPDPVDHWQAAWETARANLTREAREHAVAVSEARKPAETATDTHDTAEARVNAARQWLDGLEGLPVYSDEPLTWPLVRSMGVGSKVVYQGSPWYRDPTPAPVPGFIVEIPTSRQSGLWVVLRGSKEGESTGWVYVPPANLRAVVTPKPADIDITVKADVGPALDAAEAVSLKLAYVRYAMAVQRQKQAMAALDGANADVMAAGIDVYRLDPDKDAALEFLQNPN